MTFSTVCAHWPIEKERQSQTEKDTERQRWIMIHYSMPSTLTYPSGVSYFLQLLLTLLPPVALITGPKWALQAQGHVFGMCYESAT